MQLRLGAAEPRTLTIVDVDAAVVLQVQALVEADGGAVHHAAPSPGRGRESVAPVAAVGWNLQRDGGHLNRRSRRPARITVLITVPRTRSLRWVWMGAQTGTVFRGHGGVFV